MLIKPPPHSRNLVFTSAGDSANLELWLGGRKDFDLWITYYGDRDGQYRGMADYYNVRKGGKYSNLYYIYRTWKDIVDRYEAIMVMDDDIIINASEISRLFEIRERFGLWLLQPAFSPAGRISHPITAVHPFTLLRYTNFVEMNCPLFKKDKLDEFMGVYDPVLEGYGIDWWYLNTIGRDLAGKVAVIDAVYCINPHTKTKKGGKRECRKIETKCLAMEKWKRIKALHHIEIDEQDYRTFGSVRKIKAQDLWLSGLYCLSLLKRTIRSSGRL